MASFPFLAWSARVLPPAIENRPQIFLSQVRNAPTASQQALSYPYSMALVRRRRRGEFTDLIMKFVRYVL